MRITCPACGANMEIPGDDGWGVLNCVDCGKRIRFGEAPPQQAGDKIDFNFAAVAPSSPQYTRPEPVRHREWRKTLLALSVGAMATAMLVVLVVVLQRTLTTSEPPAASAAPWDQSHRTDLLTLKNTADALARQGKWQESYNTYQQILTLVGDHEVKDPVAAAIVAAVLPGQDRAMSAMLSDKPIALPAPPVVAQPKPATGPVIAAATTHAASTPPTTRSATAPSTVTMPQATLDPAQLAADTAPPLPGPPPEPPALHAYTLPDAVTDEQIGDAINKAVKFLSGQFVGGEVSAGVRGNPNVPLPAAKTPDRGPPSDLDHTSDLGDLPTRATPTALPPPRFAAPHTVVFSTPGIDALCVYALLNAGRAMDVPGLGAEDPFTEQIVARLKSYNMEYTYHRSLRAAALAVFGRPQDTAALEDDVRWLMSASIHGAYTYELPGGNTEQWDNSNSQYGLLGVWSGAQAGIAIPNSYWSEVESHWLSCTSGEGTWGYTQGGNSLTMTCAGVASLLVARDYLDTGQLADRPVSKTPLEAGLSWLDAGDNSTNGLSAGGSGGVGYCLYGLERVGLASGFKYFGRHDWYSELAKTLVREQNLNGSWGAAANGQAVAPMTLINTAYSLLFLARGRHPILFNKLRYDGTWNNRPHDVAHLSRYAAHELERPLNWQVVNLRRDWFDWLDCPVLYISGNKALALTEHDYTALRDFADGGGLIFTHADGGSAAFNHWVEMLVRKIFPQYELMQVPRDHPLYSTVYPLKNPQPLLSVSNGSRLLLVHSPTDLAAGWQLNWTEEKKPAFQMGVNLFVYAAGKGNLKNRLASTYIPEDPEPAEHSRQIARLQYAGEWDPEPYAWTRFSRYFQWETRRGIEIATVPLNSLAVNAQPLAILTGAVAHDFTTAESNAARAYVESGGILLIDACGGQRDFAKSIEQTLLATAFPGVTPEPLAGNHPLLVPSRPHAEDLTRPLLRQFAIENGGRDLPLLAFPWGKGWVIFSRLDLTTGLLGTQSWGIRGYSAAYAQALMKNAVLWADARSPFFPPPLR